MRQLSDDFWTVRLPNQDRSYPVQDAVQLMVTAINESPVPVTVFSSGPLTSLALAMQTSPGIRDNIEAVYVMGGAVNVPGNIPGLEPNSTNTVAEWNLYVDPQAAHEVFTSGLDLYLVPLDATDQVTINIEDTRLWRTGGKAAGYAADLYDHSFVNYGMKVTEIWDLLATVVMVDPELCRFQRLSLEVVTAQGNAAGQLVSQPGGAPNVSVCLQPDPDLVRQRMIEVFSGSE
jgi:purine nucleosidase/pyrimidine-specific ribonucleoside hydrolase